MGGWGRVCLGRSPADGSMLEGGFCAGEGTETVATVKQHIPADYASGGGGRCASASSPRCAPTDERFYEFCRLNRELHIERGAQGEVTITVPAGWESGRRNAEVTARLQV